MKILLIAGHGAGDPGATSTIQGVNYQEAAETRAVVALLSKALAGSADVTVYDTSRNAFYDHQSGKLKSLAQFAKYDYVLEVHFNASSADAGNGSTKGVECYVTTAESATKVEEAVVGGIAALGLRNRGVKRYNWSVIHAAKSDGVSSALLEVCFLDDADDMAVYLQSRQAVAQAIAAGIREGFGLSEQTEMTATEAKKIIMEKAGLSAATITYLDSYKYADALLIKLAQAMK